MNKRLPNDYQRDLMHAVGAKLKEMNDYQDQLRNLVLDLNDAANKAYELNQARAAAIIEKVAEEIQAGLDPAEPPVDQLKNALDESEDKRKQSR